MVLKYLIFLVHIVSMDAVMFRCDYSYSDVGWLKYHEIPANWSDAKLRCRFEGAMLASPTTQQLKIAMMNKTRYVGIFTGIHAISPGSYYTINGIPLDAINHRWVEDEPDNKNDDERCIAMNSDGKFFDVNCNVPRPYICHKPHSTESANICGTTDPEYHLESRTNKCYKFHPVPRTYNRAHFVCSAEGGHLAIINNQQESEVLRDLFSRNSAKMIGNFDRSVVAIGFFNHGESADWRTLHGQTLAEAGFQSFASGQPNFATSKEYCGSILNNGLLNDHSCEGFFAFICEKDPYYPPLCDSSNFTETEAVIQNDIKSVTQVIKTK